MNAVVGFIYSVAQSYYFCLNNVLKIDLKIGFKNVLA